MRKERMRKDHAEHGPVTIILGIIHRCMYTKYQQHILTNRAYITPPFCKEV